MHKKGNKIMKLGKLKPVSIKLHEGLISSLDELLSENGLNRSQLIRQLLNDYIELQNKKKKRTYSGINNIRNILG